MIKKNQGLNSEQPGETDKRQPTITSSARTTNIGCCEDNRAVKTSLLVLTMKVVTGELLPLMEEEADGWLKYKP